MKLSCQCKNIEVDWNTVNSAIVARKCGCQYCIEKDADYVSDADSQVSFKINNPQQHKSVQQGTNTADFHECTNCGLVLVTCEIEGVVYAVLNAKVLALKNYSLNQTLNDLTNESIDLRLARRQKTWIKVCNKN